MLLEVGLSNLKHDRNLYRVYFLTQLLLFSLFFVLQCFSSDQVIVDRLAEDTNIETMIQTISLFFMVAIIFYFLYFNQFFIRQRAEELGIYSILGFRCQEIVRLFLVENVILLFLAGLCSLALGYVFYLGLRTGLIKFLKLALPLWGFKIDSTAFLAMLGLFLSIVLLIYLELSLIFKKNLADILNLQQQQDKTGKLHPWLAFLGLLGIISADGLFLNLLAGANSLWLKIGYMPVLALTVALLGSGSILFILFSLPYLVNFLLNKKHILYGTSGIVVLPRMRHRLQNKGRLLTMLTLLTTGSVMLLGVTILTLFYPYEATKRIVPVALETVASQKRTLTKQQLSKLERDFDATVVQTEILRTKLNEKWYFSNQNASDHLDLISLKSYNRLMKLQQQIPLTAISAHQGVLVNYYASKQTINQQFSLKNEAEPLMVKRTTNNNPFAFANSVVTVVVNDADFNQYKTRHLADRYWIISFEGANLRDDQAFVTAFKKKTNVAYISAQERDQTITNANSPTFLMITLVSILFFVAISTVLYFTARIEELSLVKEYDTLAKLGYRIKDLRRVIFTENTWLFLPPLLLGLLNGIFGVLGISYFITDSITTGLWLRLGQPLVYTLCLFLPIYLLVYVLAGNSILKEIVSYCRVGAKRQ
ncbi:ABC transporter permease [Ligilactobacillus apodemi]|nr:ABC transporter permease [Ligilactobacillus apodemi]